MSSVRTNECETVYAVPPAVVLGAIDDGIAVQDANGALLFANEVASQLLGLRTASALLATPLAEITQRLAWHDEAGAPFPVKDLPNRVVLAGGAPCERVVQLIDRSTRAERWLLIRATGIRDRGGSSCVVTVLRDVTAKRKEEQRRLFVLRAAAEINSSLDYERTLATVARLAVPTIADWCAVDVLELEGMKRLAVAHVDPSKVEFVHEVERRYPPDPHATNGVPNVLKTGQPEMMTDIPDELLTASAKDEEHLALIRQLGLRSYIAVPIRRSGKTIGVITLATAESQRVYDEGDLETALTLADRAAVAIENARLYRELEVARASAELANRAKDEFLAMLGHELRNPLAPILTAVEMMQAKNPGALGQERAIIDRQLRHMVRLVDDLLDVSRIARHKIDIVRECVDLSEVVQQALEMATPLFRDRDHTVAVDAPPGLLVDGDAVRLTQVVSNLLTNAAKYTQRGGRVEIQGVSRGGSVTLRVRDNGIGLAPEMLPRIFDLFVQDKQASDRAQGGLGLGLTIVRNLIELHGGSVTAHSDGPGRGVEIKVELPACVDRSTSVAPRQGTEVPPAPSSAPATVTRPRILVVDDNIDARDLLAMSLELKGYAVSTAGDGPSALEVARELQPAIALLDIGLPGMDGYELGRQLRMLPGLGKIHLIAVTGYGQSSDRERSHSASFADHLVKPIKLATLAAMLEKWTPPDRST